MDRPFPLKFELPSPAKQLRVERVMPKMKVKEPWLSGHWRLWLMANSDYSLGTFIQLVDSGTINRITWHEDGTETIFEVKNAKEK